MTSEVVTRYWRPPELCAIHDGRGGRYDFAIDIWSCGCVIAQMLSPTPWQAFFRADNDEGQLKAIVEKFPWKKGAPSNDELGFSDSAVRVRMSVSLPIGPNTAR